MKKIVLTGIAVALAGSAIAVYAQQTATAAQLGVAQIVQKLEAAGYRDIHELDHEGSRWEVEATAADGRRVELDVDATDGRVLKEQEDRD